MNSTSSSRLHAPLAVGLALALVAGAAACASGPAEIPTPRRLVIYSGERLSPTRPEMQEVDGWVREEMDSIQLDPSFMIITQAESGPVYPWTSLVTNEAGDTASIGFQANAIEIRGPYMIYAHLHLMADQGRLEKWLPEVGPDPSEWELERAIVARMADSWLYSRSVFDATPYGLLDELIYAKDAGYLEPFILSARPDSFVEARREWEQANPGGMEEYRQWFLDTFQREPPGMRGATPS